MRTLVGFKLFEVLLITFTMSLIACFLPCLYALRTLAGRYEGLSEQEKTLVLELNPLYCTSGTHYNELASLWLTDSDGAIKHYSTFARWEITDLHLQQCHLVPLCCPLPRHGMYYRGLRCTRWSFCSLLAFRGRLRAPGGAFWPKWTN